MPLRRRRLANLTGVRLASIKVSVNFYSAIRTFRIDAKHSGTPAAPSLAMPTINSIVPAHAYFIAPPAASVGPVPAAANGQSSPTIRDLEERF